MTDLEWRQMLSKALYVKTKEEQLVQGKHKACRVTCLFHITCVQKFWVTCSEDEQCERWTMESQKGQNDTLWHAIGHEINTNEYTWYLIQDGHHS